MEKEPDEEIRESEECGKEAQEEEAFITA